MNIRLFYEICFYWEFEQNIQAGFIALFTATYTIGCIAALIHRLTRRCMNLGFHFSMRRSGLDKGTAQFYQGKKSISSSESSHFGVPHDSSIK